MSVNDSDKTLGRRNVAEALMIALIRTGNHGAAAVANYNSVITLRYIASCLFYDRSTYVDKLLSGFVQERSYIILVWKRFSVQANDFIRI